MLRNTLFTLLILIVGKCYAQQEYFVLIQADNNQPFYVQLPDKTLSSTLQGRLILSQLQDGNHSIIIGFPKQLYPEQQFTFEIGGKDLEFHLKDLGEKGWGLFNPQTQQLKTADKKEVKTMVHSEGVKKDDAFSRLMAGVVSDTAVMYNTYAMEEALKDSPVVHDSLAAVPLTAPVVTDGLTPTSDSSRKADLPVPGDNSNQSHKADLSVSGGTSNKSRKTKPPRSAKSSNQSRNTEPSGSADSSNQSLKTERPGSADARELSQKTNPPGSTSTPNPSHKGDSSASAINPDLSRKKDTSASIGLSGTDSSQLVPSGKPLSVVVKLSERKTSKGLRLAFADRPKGRKADTIIVIIPLDSSQPMAVGTNPASPGSSVSSSRNSELTAKGSVPVTGSLSPGADSSHTPTSSPHTPPATGDLFRAKPDSSLRRKETKPQIVNSDCRNFATDYDVDRLRVKMLDISKDEDRIGAAKKIFKTKCFTTKQIRALSEVFTTDAVKFRFFETAYPFVSDDHFRELTDLLADPVYNAKFRAMTGQQ